MSEKFPDQRLLQAQDWLIGELPAMRRELEELCNLNSGSENLPGLNLVANHLANLFSDFNFACRRHALQPRSVMDDLANIQNIATGPALQWNSKSQSERSVLLAIHYDTVYGRESSFQTCRQLDEDRLNGPGVIDAKGGIIVLRWAVKAGLQFGLLDDLRWTILLTPDEEIGSPSSYPLWKSMAGQCDFAMLFEPTLADGSLVDRRKGTGSFVWTIRGKSAHSGRNFPEGRNALVHAARLASRLDELNGRRDGVTINVGRMRSGDAINVVPDLAVLRVNVRVEDAEQQAWIEEQLKHLTEIFHQPSHHLFCVLEGGIHAPPKVIDEATAHWMRRIEQCGQQLGQTIRWRPSGGASDGNKTAALGLPTIDTFGPEGDFLHSPDEWVRLSSLPRKAALALGVMTQVAITG